MGGLGKRGRRRPGFKGSTGGPFLWCPLTGVGWDFLFCFSGRRRERGQHMGLECFFLVFVMHICRIRWGWFGVGIKGEEKKGKESPS